MRKSIHSFGEMGLFREFNYTDRKHFQDFIAEHSIADNRQLLIQIFTSHTDEADLVAMTEEIASFSHRPSSSDQRQPA